MYFGDGIEKESKYIKCAVSKEVQQESENDLFKIGTNNELWRSK
jgi:hypothetical protein